MSSEEPRVLINDRDATVCERCIVAQRPFARMKGLLGSPELPAGDGLLLLPAPSVHTWFMRFPIDVVFLDWDLTVMDVVEGLKPWRAAGRRRARAVLELAPGEARRRNIRRGDRLKLVDEEPGGPAVIFVPMPAGATQ
jgi:uncharacterized membrane protein (UPF0127 family)